MNEWLLSNYFTMKSRKKMNKQKIVTNKQNKELCVAPYQGKEKKKFKLTSSQREDIAFTK